MITLTLGPAFGIGIGLAFGSAQILMGGLAGKESHAWVVYVLVVAYLAATHQLPWRLMGFLDDAHRLGLLHQEGPVYQFRNS
ncbi:hypothetical protein [Streptomyces sp. NPDC021622]|uniref:hypothetical protein n=1 Tax=Streptomyces sp. NPDC021622 TaxID=3155013 RepID=UPI00340102DB